MKLIWLFATILAGSLASAVGAEEDRPAADEAAIRKAVDSYVAAFNQGDAKALASLWSPEGVYTNPLSGEQVVGREAIENQFAGIFSEAKGIKLEATTQSIGFVSPNVAVEQGAAKVIRADQAPEESEYTAVYVKRDGQWLLDRVTEEDVPAPLPSHYEQLKDLEWMVGRWVDQDDQAAVVTECNWTKNNNFLTRYFAVQIRDRMARRDEIYDQIDDGPIRDFWQEYPGWAALRITRPYRWATWGAITGWVGYGWSEPVSYSYGDTVYYEGDTVYQGDQPVASVEEYTQQAETIVEAAPQELPADAQWMPLGVFALTPDGQASGPAPTLFLQLAISKEGIISGTFTNTATNQTQGIEGMADKDSQRCAWTVIGKTRPIMETGISNLTEDTAPVLVHFADGQTQQWLMVRLEEPTTQQ